MSLFRHRRSGGEMLRSPAFSLIALLRSKATCVHGWFRKTKPMHSNALSLSHELPGRSSSRQPRYLQNPDADVAS